MLESRSLRGQRVWSWARAAGFSENMDTDVPAMGDCVGCRGTEAEGYG